MGNKDSVNSFGARDTLTVRGNSYEIYRLDAVPGIEERAADYILANIAKPVVAYVAGFTAPEGKTMGHAGAIVSGSSCTAGAKKAALEAVGVKVGRPPSETADLAHVP